MGLTDVFFSKAASASLEAASETLAYMTRALNCVGGQKQRNKMLFGRRMDFPPSYHILLPSVATITTPQAPCTVYLWK